MLRIIGTLIVFGGLFPGATQTAVAHGRVDNHYNPPKQYRVTVYRDKYMPRWLRQEKGFRRWYTRSSVRQNHNLQWWQLYEIYRWEKQYDSRRRRHHTAYNGRHSYDWYRRYWRDYDRLRRDDRHDARRRHRSYD